MIFSTCSLFKTIKQNSTGHYLNDSDRVALQQVLAMMLEDISSLCASRDIEWCMAGGLCLGSIRHRGFIPWDDDLDIFVSRKDYSRLEYAIQEDIGEKYEIKSPARMGYGLGIGRIILKNTIYRGRDDFGSSGVFCDVFILDNAPNDPVLRAMHGVGSLTLGLIQSCCRFAEHEEQYKALAEGNPELEKAVRNKVALGRLFGFRSADAWTRSWDYWNSKCKDNDSVHITCPAGRKHYFGELYRRDDFFPVSYGEFEGLRVPLPAHPEVYMKALYGPDYMTPPEEKDRERHIVLEFDLGEYDPRKQNKGESK